MRERTWVILLAGGADPHEAQNDRINNSSGRFGAPRNRETLLNMTLSRARSLAPREQIVAVIDRAQKHRWSESLAMLPGGNIITQPHHRGSAIEVMLAVLTILERDTSARIIVMPSHHYVGNETALAGSLLDAAAPTAQTRNNVAIIGIKPERPATETGYIVPGRWFEDGTRSVLRIVKPSGKVVARDLVARGALWDSSIVAARASVLSGLLRACMPDPIDQIETALAQGDGADVRQRALAKVYAGLPSIDLSYVWVQSASAVCRVITSRSCGWSNLASAQRTITARRPAAGRVAETA
jgi:mannose-1-phosphate guanylyltransferase